MNTESYRKRWNKQQRELRQSLVDPDQFRPAIQLLISQHAALHSAQLEPSEPWSYEDDILNDLTEEQVRRIPHNQPHSVAWCIWHIARIEDVTMNLLVAGSPQILNQEPWLKRLNITVRHTGNLMTEAEIASLSAAIAVPGLRAYRLAVGRRTQEIIGQLQPQQLKEKVAPARLQQIMAEGAVIEAARDLIDYWSKRDIAGLLLMPATRHNFVHLNEAYQLKGRRR